LFFDREGGPDVDAAIRASQNNSAAALHTLACMYAELDKAGEARDLLIQYMTARNMSKPDESTWYGFGRIAELYGERELARAAYSKLRPSPMAAAEYESTYSLAQHRLSIMGQPEAASGTRRKKSP
jgi:hypothetical protein